MGKPSLFNPGYRKAVTGGQLVYSSEAVKTLAVVPKYTMYRIHVGCTTAFNDGTAAVINIGTTSGGTEIATTDVSSTGDTFYTGTTGSSEITVYVAYAGTDDDASTGVANVIIETLATTEFGVEP